MTKNTILTTRSWFQDPTFDPSDPPNRPEPDLDLERDPLGEEKSDFHFCSLEDIGFSRFRPPDHEIIFSLEDIEPYIKPIEIYPQPR